MSEPIKGKLSRLQSCRYFASDEVGGLADAMEKGELMRVGITIEESKTMKTELDLVEGMQLTEVNTAYKSVQIWRRWKQTFDDPISLLQIKRFSNIQ